MENETMEEIKKLSLTQLAEKLGFTEESVRQLGLKQAQLMLLCKKKGI